MADFNSVIAIKMSGEIGDKLIRTLPSGKMIINQKAALPTFDDKELEEKRDVRIKGFGGSGHIVPVVRPALRVGFPGLKRGQTYSGQFMKENATTLCDAERGEDGKLHRVYDYRSMVIARGAVTRPAVTVTVTAETNKIMFEQEADLTPSASKDPEDQVYGFVLDATNEQAELIVLRKRGESGSTSFSIPADWDKEKLFIYSFAAFHDKKRASASVCLYPADSVRDALIRVNVEDSERDTDGATIIITRSKQKRMGKSITPDDQVYAVVIDTVSGESTLHPLGRRGKNSTTRVTLEKGTNPARVHVYTFTVLKDLSRASTPVCHNAPGGVEMPPVTVTREGKTLAVTTTTATAPGEHLYAMAFNAIDNQLELVDLATARAKDIPGLTLAPGRGCFYYTLAISADGRTGEEQLTIEN